MKFCNSDMIENGTAGQNCNFMETVSSDAEQKKEDAEKKAFVREEADIVKRDGMNRMEQTVEVPLYHMMVIQYEDGQKKNFFYPGRYKIDGAKKVRRTLLLRRKEKSFCVEWEVTEETDKGRYKIKGSCRAKILSYSKGIASYLFQEKIHGRDSTFSELISERVFFQESLKRKIAFLLREMQRQGKEPERQKIEELLNKKWIYENGVCFFEFLIKEMKTEEEEKKEQLRVSEEVKKMARTYQMKKLRDQETYGCGQEQLRRSADDAGKKIGTFDPRECGMDRNLSSVEIPEGYETIGEDAFRGWKNLKEIRMPKTIREIGERAFYGCQNLSVICLSSGLKTIRKEAFFQCESLEELNLPPHTEEIGIRAFEYCDCLQKVYLPSVIKKIGADAFEECPIKQFVLEKGIAKTIERQMERRFPTAQFQTTQR